MRGFPTKTMAQLFVVAAEQWTQHAPAETVPDFYRWCLARQLLGTAPEQFKPQSTDSKAATDPDFDKGTIVTFVDGSVAVRDLDELRHRRPGDWRALPPLPEDQVAQRSPGGTR